MECICFRRSVPDLDHSVPALANCPGTEMRDTSSGTEGRLGQNVQDPQKDVNNFTRDQ